jgi:hypothetical protein
MVRARMLSHQTLGLPLDDEIVICQRKRRLVCESDSRRRPVGVSDAQRQRRRMGEAHGRCAVTEKMI